MKNSKIRKCQIERLYTCSALRGKIATIIMQQTKRCEKDTDFDGWMLK